VGSHRLASWQKLLVSGFSTAMPCMHVLSRCRFIANSRSSWQSLRKSMAAFAACVLRTHFNMHDWEAISRQEA